MIILNSKIWEATVEEAKAKAANSPEWLRAIAKADQLLRRSSTYWAFDATNGVLRLMSDSSEDHIYVITAENHSCPAVMSGRKACYHRAAHRLMCRYVEQLQQTSPQPAALEGNEYMQSQPTTTHRAAMAATAAA